MTVPYVKDRHDLGILRQDGSTKVGLMLLKGSKEYPTYQLVDDEYLSNQYFTGSPDYNSLPSEKELSLRQDDWRSGVGLEIYDTNNSKRYYYSVGMDMRFRNMGILSNAPTAISYAQAYTDPTWLTPDGHTDTGATWASETLAYDNDSATLGASYLCTGGATDWLELNTASISCEKVRIYPQRSAVGITVMEVDVYYGAAWHNIFNGTPTYGAWNNINVGSTQTITKARVRWTTTSGGDTAYINEFAFNVTGNIPAAVIPCSAEFNDLLYVAIGNTLVKLNGTGNGWTTVAALPGTISSLKVFGSNLFIALGSSTTYWYMSTAEAFTKSTATVNTFQFFEVVNATTPVIWGNDGANTIRSNTNPVNGGAAWSAQKTVDVSWNSITKLLSYLGALYIMKEDMPYYLDSSGNVQNDLAPEASAMISSTSGKNSTVWLAKLYIPLGEQSLLEIDSGINTWRNPANTTTNLANYNGKVQGLAYDDAWLYAILDNGTEIEILAGREETIDGSTSWVWHAIQEDTMGGCETAWVSSIYQKRLWYTNTTASTTIGIKYIALPTGYANVTSDSNKNFKTDGYFVTPWLHANFKSDNKSFIKATARLGHTYDVNIYFECHYQKLGDSSWTDAGDFIGTATNRSPTLYFPVDGSSNKPVSTMFRLKFVGKTNDTAKTPILYSYDIRAILIPTNRRILKCSVYCSDEIVLKDGTIDRGSAATIKATLEEARAATWPVTVYDINGDTKYCRFLPMTCNLVAMEKGRKLETIYNLTLQEVALS